MGGRIEVASAPGEGSTFRLALALPRTENGGGAPAPDLSGRAVLIVARESIEAAILARRLRRWRATVEVAEASLAAAMLQERRWDALLVDHALGAETTSVFIGSVGEAVARRIVLITPPERHGLAALKEAGFTGYLVKPVRAASLAIRLTATTFRCSRTSATGGAILQSWSPRTTRSTPCSPARCWQSSATVRRSRPAGSRHSIAGAAATPPARPSTSC
jgi:DNA-binding response OmpR family regulator